MSPYSSLSRKAATRGRCQGCGEILENIRHPVDEAGFATCLANAERQRQQLVPPPQFRRIENFNELLTEEARKVHSTPVYNTVTVYTKPNPVGGVDRKLAQCCYLGMLLETSLMDFGTAPVKHRAKLTVGVHRLAAAFNYAVKKKFIGRGVLMSATTSLLVTWDTIRRDVLFVFPVALVPFSEINEAFGFEVCIPEGAMFKVWPDKLPWETEP